MSGLLAEDSGFDVEFCEPNGRVRREPLGLVWAYGFELVPPVREFPLYRGQRNRPGFRWSSSTGRLVGFESWMERDRAMLLDFDPSVSAYSSQPFWLHWLDPADGSPRRHAPDYFVRKTDGSALVVDVRQDERVAERDAQAFAATERACGVVGWGFLRVGPAPPVLTENVRWLSGYRRPVNMNDEFAARAAEVFSCPTPVFAGAEQIGMRIRVLPVIYHLLWRHVLAADLESEPIGPRTLVWAEDVGAS